MKKIYTFLIIATLAITTYAQGPIITGIMDGDCPGGLPKIVEIYAHGTVDFSLYSLENQTNANTEWGNTYDMSEAGTVTDDFIYFYTDDEVEDFFGANFPSASNAHLITASVVSFNGDDRIRIIETATSTVIDQYGVDSVDGSDTDWEYKDGYGKRNSDTGANGGAFNPANWTNGNGLFDGEGSCQSGTLFETIYGIGTYTPPTSETPLLGITYPSGDLNPEMTDVDVSFVVQNFVVASGGAGDGYIEYSLDGGSVMDYFSTDPIALNGLTAGAHTFDMELVDNSGNPLNPAVTASTSFNIAAYTDVANLAALRAGTVGEYYRVTGEVFGTYGQDYRNQKWCQDATGGILIDDNDGIITTVYNEGDGVVNLRGQLGFYNVLQLIPTADPGTTGNNAPVTPEVITIADLASGKALADYESELVQINGVSISDYDDGGAGTADGTFQTGQNYPIDDGTAASTLRTNFFDADYIGTNLPTEPMSYVCIVGAFDDIAQVTPRDLGDIFTLGINDLPQIAGFELYPNPVTDGIVHINTANNEAKDISIYNLVGKLVYQTNTSATSINIDELDAGIYMIQVVEAGHVATRKLLVK